MPRSYAVILFNDTTYCVEIFEGSQTELQIIRLSFREIFFGVTPSQLRENRSLCPSLSALQRGSMSRVPSFCVPGQWKSSPRRQARSRLLTKQPHQQPSLLGHNDRALDVPAKSTSATSSQLLFFSVLRGFFFKPSQNILSQIIFRPHTSSRLQFKCVWYETWKLVAWDVAVCVVDVLLCAKRKPLLSRSRCKVLLLVGNPVFLWKTGTEWGSEMPVYSRELFANRQDTPGWHHILTPFLFKHKTYL